MQTLKITNVNNVLISEKSKIHCYLIDDWLMICRKNFDASKVNETMNFSWKNEDHYNVKLLNKIYLQTQVTLLADRM